MNNYTSFLYGGSLSLRLNEVLHQAQLPCLYSSQHLRDSSFGYISLEEFLIKTNYPREAMRDMDIAIEDKPLQSISAHTVYADSNYLYFYLKESRMDCTKIYLDLEQNIIPIRYLSYLSMDDKKWGTLITF